MMGGCIYLVKRIAIIGSTGSIGTQALDIISDYPDQFEVKALVVHQTLICFSCRLKTTSQIQSSLLTVIRRINCPKGCLGRKLRLKPVWKQLQNW